MSNDDASEGESFDERAQTLNSNLQHLIEAVSGLLAASGDLLALLQQLLSGAQRPAHDGGDGSWDTPPPEDHRRG